MALVLSKKPSILLENDDDYRNVIFKGKTITKSLFASRSFARTLSHQFSHSNSKKCSQNCTFCQMFVTFVQTYFTRKV